MLNYKKESRENQKGLTMDYVLVVIHEPSDLETKLEKEVSTYMENTYLQVIMYNKI